MASGPTHHHKHEEVKKFRKLTYMIFAIAMLFLGFLHVTPPVTASAILVTPMGQTIKALPNTNFTLNFKMKFDQNDYGYFSVTFYWDNNETAPEPEKWNFTYQGFACKFTDGTPFSGPIKVSTGKYGSGDYPGYYRYIVGIVESYGESYGNETHPKEFWLNVTMRNAGLKNGTYYPHAIGDQNIKISNVRCYESSQISSGGGVVTVRSESFKLDVYVYNTAGSPLQNALVIVKDSEGNEKWRKYTDSYGHASGNLTSGSYTIYVSKSGYYSQSRGIYIDSDRVENFYLSATC